SIGGDKAEPMFRGLYINLQRSIDRKTHIESELARFNLLSHYERLNAIDGSFSFPRTPGWVGCFRSHINALEIAAASRDSFVHILEDDAILSSRLEGFLSSSTLARALKRFDIVLLDNWVDPDFVAVSRYRELRQKAGNDVRVESLKGLRLGAMDSYVV